MTSFLSTELSYLAAFCTAKLLPKGVRLRDDEITDMYAHNLTYITHSIGEQELWRILAQERRLRKQEGMPFLNLTMEAPPPLKVQARLCEMRGEATVYGYYKHSGAIPAKRRDCAIWPMDESTVNAALAFDLAVNGPDFGHDFVQRRFERRKGAYLSGRIQHHLCWHAGRIVGMCDLYICQNHAKIEDFDIAPAHQRQGFGTSMLFQLTHCAHSAGAGNVYLVTDQGDTAKNMYKKSGFSLAARKYEIVLPV